MIKFKKPLVFALCLLPIAVIAGIFVGFHQLDTLSEEAIEELVGQVGSTDALILIGAVQSLLYTFFCAFFGYILADKLGLWRGIRIERKSLIITLLISVVGGAVFSLDHWIFGSMIDGIQSANLAGLTVSGVIASILYGGIIEEVMLRLFFMSLIAFILWKLFSGKKDKDSIPPKLFIIANLISALVFAAGHLPATVAIFGTLSPILLIRCFLLNGGFGFIFGEIYRRYGILYAMMSHALFHIVSKLIWILFA